MEHILQFFILVPLISSLISFFISKKNESAISGLAITATFINLAATLVFIIYWLMNSHPTLDIKHLVLFATKDIEIFIDFYFDKVSAVYALVGSVLMFIVTIFSRYYLHREEGFKRYFIILLFFFLGYNIVVFSGNFETLFVGWEIIGLCSFLLITFYRDRYLPVKNGLKTISIYRLGDICVILTMWMSHQLWHENITFLKLNDLALVHEHLAEHNWYGVFIAFMILVAAATKSAQFPFSSWLPRAMEGPTTSSAIFYGSLSVHLGLFLLLRTFPYWESIDSIRALVIITGIFTSIVATGIARVQSTVKTQIAYSSTAQIGLMFAEVGFGFHELALVHFAGNAFLRTYQLLVSPSVLSYLVHDMFFNFKARNNNGKDSIFNKIKNSLYILSVKEWNLDFFLYQFLWKPFKWVGGKLDFLTKRTASILLIVIYLLGLYFDLYPDNIAESIYEYLPLLFSLFGLLLILKSFTETGDALRGWIFIIAGQSFIALSIALLHEDFGHNFMLMYLGGSIVCSVVGYICLKKIRAIDNDIRLSRFHGYVYEQPKLAFIFLFSCIGLLGFPFTPTFIGIDLIFSHIHKQEIAMIVCTALSFIFIELSVLRIYARIFWGQHKKTYHAIAHRAS